MALRLHRDPDLCWPPARLPDFHPCSVLIRQERQCGADPVSRLMPTKQVADGRSGHALPAVVMESAQYVIGDAVAQARPEDMRGNLGVFPNRQRGLDVG
jgi:hypothetical protein